METLRPTKDEAELCVFCAKFSASKRNYRPCAALLTAKANRDAQLRTNEIANVIQRCNGANHVITFYPEEKNNLPCVSSIENMMLELEE
jgi:hypothetical protein